MDKVSYPNKEPVPAHILYMHRTVVAYFCFVSTVVVLVEPTAYPEIVAVEGAEVPAHIPEELVPADV